MMSDKQGLNGPKQELIPHRLPITPAILVHLQTKWITSPPSHDGLMLWQVFWGSSGRGSSQCRRPAPMTRKRTNLHNLAIDSHTCPSLFRVRLKQSKTDPFRQGADIYQGATGATICPVRALWSYLAKRGPAPGPLFVFNSGTPLTRMALVDHLHQALQQSAFEPNLYNGHSFSNWSRNNCGKAGIDDSLIQTLGRWKSAAYLAYIKIPRQQLASISSQLLKDHH